MRNTLLVHPGLVVALTEAELHAKPVEEQIIYTVSKIVSNTVKFISLHFDLEKKDCLCK